jgi:hypothetical protein
MSKTVLTQFHKIRKNTEKMGHCPVLKKAVFHAFNVLLKAEIPNSPRGNRGGGRGVACQQNSSNLPITKINRPRRGDAIRTAWFDMWCATTLSLSVPSHCVEPVTQHVLHFDMFDQSRDREVE